MPHRIVTKDGIAIEDIPDDVQPTDQRVRDQVAQMRKAGIKSLSFGAPVDPTGEAAMLGAAARQAPAPQGVEATPPRKQTPLEFAGQVVSELPQNAGVALEGFTKGAMSIPTAVFDPIALLINKVIPGANEIPPSQALTLMFRKLGVKEPENAAQEVLQAATMGLGSSAAGLGTGAALSSGAPALGMGTKIQGIGQALATQPIQDLAGSATSMGASKIAEQQGASPLAQAAIGFGAGYGASRLASPAAAIMPKASAVDESVGDAVGRAARGKKDAMASVADTAQYNAKSAESAQRLDLDLPADVFADNEQVRAAAGLGRSVAGGYEEAAWRGTVKKTVEQIDDILEEAGATFVEGTPAPAVTSARVKDSMLATRKALKETTTKIYDEVDEAIPKSTPIKLDNLRAELQAISDELGGEGFTPLEKQLLDVATSDTATYGRLIRLKSEIRSAIKKNSGPYKDLEEATKLRLQNAVAKDQLDNVAQIGSPELMEKLVSANLLYGKQKDLGDQITYLFGGDFAGSISDKMKMAIKSTAEGETGPFIRLMEQIPDDLKKEVTATSLASVARSGSGATAGRFGLSEFAKIYPKIRANKEVYKQIAENLGPESDALLRDIFEVSKRLTDSRAMVLTTGKANQALLQGLTAQNLVEKALSSVVGKSAVSAGGAALGGIIGKGTFGASVGAGTANALVESLTRGEKSKLEAVGKLFRSREFQDLIVNAGKTDTITPSQAKALARSGAFQSFAKAVKLPMATDQLDTWILSAATAKTAEAVGDQVQAKRQMKELER